MRLGLVRSDFNSHTGKFFGSLLEEDDFTDITLVCEGQRQIRAHKAILSSSSKFFRDLLTQNIHPHPLIYFKLKYVDLNALVRFIYLGQCEVEQSDIDNFMDIARELEVEGLNSTTNNELYDLFYKDETQQHNKIESKLESYEIDSSTSTILATQTATSISEEAADTTHQPISLTRSEAISWMEATSLLLDRNIPTVIKMPFKAASNTLWKFRKTGQEDFTDQGYSWVEPGGVKRLKNGLSKRVFNVRSASHLAKRGNPGFQMMVWQQEEQRPGEAIVHIMGDSSLARDFPHGNSKQ